MHFSENNQNILLYIGILVGSIIVIACIILFVLFFVRRKHKETKEEPKVFDNSKWVNALGGNDNLISLEAKGSRLIVKLNNNTLINKDELHELGVTSIISSQDKITLVLKEKAENICDLLK